MCSSTISDRELCRAFLNATTVLTCSLLGSLVAHTLSRTSEGKLQANKTWSINTAAVKKVNAIAVENDWLTVGGLSKDAKGVIEILKFNQDLPPSESS